MPNIANNIPIDSRSRTTVVFNDTNQLSYAQLLGQEQTIERPLIGFCSCGQATLRIDGQLHSYRQGECIFLLPHTRVVVVRVSDDFYEQQVRIGDRAICSLLKGRHNLYYSYLKLHPIALLGEREREIIQKYIHLLLLYLNITSSFDLVLHMLTYTFQLEVLGAFVASISKPSQLNAASPRDRMLFQQFLTHVEQHHRRDRSVYFYARLARLSTQTFSLSIKQVSGHPPKYWINRKVLATIYELLEDPTLSLTAIAERLHFSSLPVFSLFFKNQEGVSPSDFRDNL